MFTAPHLYLYLLLLALSGQRPAMDLTRGTQQPPNVVLIFMDDMGYGDIGVFGAKDIPTPNMDGIAADGVQLTNFYAAQPVCSASRAALLTGCYPNRIGIHNALMPNSPVGINPEEETLAELMQAKGYRTGIFGKWHLGDAIEFLPTRHGFDEYFGIPYSNDMWPLHPQQGPVFDFPPLPLYEQEQVIDTLTDQTTLTMALTQKSVAFIERNKARPFFLYVPHPQPHVPLYVSDRFKGKSGRGLYGDVIMELDWSVGEILKALERSGLSDNTIVMVTSDNGPWLSYGNHAGSAGELREGKGTNWEGGVREPFVMKYPAGIKAGQLIDQPVMAIDILPTLVQACGLALPGKKIDGNSIWPLLSGNTSEAPERPYFYYYRVNELQAVRLGEWKLLLPHRYRSMKGQPPGGDGLPGEYTHFEVKQPELYRLSDDPAESQDLADAYPEKVSELLALAEAMRQELGDALTGAEGKARREPGRVD
ncbi:arylsulfatase [Robiginitalea myxolifaciens]|uniref:Arylsulfatase n=1 Tax=Robiginitalea myxolifaciens TaxID=400055 RepID=A0A1I6FV43_9FLAO|nr:sulfatase [Robiginitalea myxolifaciens]SFR33793.1 arylsulfatase [Robiginitalea myxolifaciens]